jgi:glucokinase
LVRFGRGALAVPSEAGHAAFPFVHDWEHAYGLWVREETGLAYCHGDAIVTGGGLARLYSYLSGVRATPREAAAALPQVPEVVERFARFYGRAARNYALYVLATGGVYITGGVSGRNPELVRHPAFLDEFRASPSHSELLARMPVFLNLNQDAGLYGAAQYAAQRLEGFGAMC